jgi:hypothetical protein
MEIGAIVEDDHSNSERSDLELPGPKHELSPDKPIAKGPTFIALASGGVRLNWRELRFGEAGKFHTYVFCR